MLSVPKVSYLLSKSRLRSLFIAVLAVVVVQLAWFFRLKDINLFYSPQVSALKYMRTAYCCDNEPL